MIEALPEFHLLRPWWLLAWLPAGLLGWRLLLQHVRNNGWASVIDRELLDALLGGPEQTSRQWPWWLLITSWLLAVLALAGPSFSRTDQAALKQADAVVVLLDLSPSMLAQDVKPSRLQAAHYKLLDLLRARREGYTALIAYAGSAHIVAPLSDDSNTIAALVTTLEPRIMPNVGSQVEDAVSEALQLLENSHFNRGRLLLLTDGVAPAAVENIHKQLRDKPVELHVIGIGTAAGAPVALHDGSFLKDGRGQVIVHKLEETPLQQLASDNGGHYSPLRLDSGDIAPLVAPPAWLMALGAGDNSRNSNRTVEHWRDSGYWFAMPCLLLTLALFRRGVLLCLLPLLMLAPAQPARALELPHSWQDWWLTPDQQGAQALADGDAKTAAQKFGNPQWKAYAEYQNGQHSEAAEHFASEDNAAAQYNRGNALAHAGDLQGAINAYDQALQQKPDLDDAQFNRQLVKKLLDQQQQKKSQQQKQQQNGQPQDPQGQQQDAQQSGEQQSPEQQTEEQQQQTGQQQSDEKKTSEQQSGEQQAAEQQSSEPKSGEKQDSEKQDGEKQGSQPQAGEQKKGEQQAGQQPGSEAAKPEQQEGKQAGDAMTDSQRRAEQEKQQATEQWLRKVPDDPGGLLKNKFEYYYQLNRQEALRQRRADQEQQEEQRW